MVTHSWLRPRMSPSKNDVPQGVMMCQCGFVGCNTHTHTTLVGDTIMVSMCRGGRRSMRILCTICSICYEPKTTLKNKLYWKLTVGCWWAIYTSTLGGCEQGQATRKTHLSPRQKPPAGRSSNPGALPLCPPSTSHTRQLLDGRFVIPLAPSQTRTIPPAQKKSPNLNKIQCPWINRPLFIISYNGIRTRHSKAVLITSGI